MRRPLDKGHGRVEHRSYFLSTDLSGLSVVEKWSGLKAIGMVESKRRSKGKVSVTRRYLHYITRCPNNYSNKINCLGFSRFDKL